MKQFVMTLLMSVVLVLPGCVSMEADNLRSISPEVAVQRLEAEENIILLDVRTPQEHEESRIPGSLLIPLQNLETEASNLLADKDAPIFVYCRSGRRSLEAAEILVDLGYQQVYDLGGIIDWPFEIERP